MPEEDKYKNLSEEDKNKKTEYEKNRYHNMSKEDKHKNLSEEDKNKKREYGKNRYHNMSEEKKQKLEEYQKKYYMTKKSKHNNNI